MVQVLPAGISAAGPVGNSRRSIAAIDWALMMVLSILWGGSYIFYRDLGDSFTPSALVAGRLIIAAAGLHLLLACRGDRLRIGRGRWADFLLLGLLNNAAPFLLIAWGELRLSSGLAAILGATTPIFGMLVGALTRSDGGFGLGRTCAVLLGFAGVIVVASPAHLGRNWGDTWAIAACLGSSLIYAMGGFYGRRFSGEALLQVATGQVTAASVLLLPLMLATGNLPSQGHASASAWASLVVMGLACTAVAYVIYFRLLARVGANNVLLVTMMVPVSSLCLGHWLLDEPISAASVGGTLLIGMALVLVDGRLFRWPRRATKAPQ